MDEDEAAGRSRVVEAMLEPAALARLAVAIGLAAEARPVLAHWAWFLDAPADAMLGQDGHPLRGGFLPALPDLPRRMFAAADITFAEPLEIGAEAVLTETVTGVRRTDGLSGPLAFVTLGRVLAQHGRERVREERTIVYRGAGAAAALPVASATAGVGDWRPGPVELFRFSAATFNAHRIHYDRSYTREVEGYPELVVQGPFTACRLAEAAARAGALRRFSFRAHAPLFANQPVAFRGTALGCEAIRCDGAVAMTVRIAR